MSMVVSLVVPRIDWIECLLSAALSAPASASPLRHRRPQRDLLPERVLVCNLGLEARCSCRRLPLPYLSKRPASALAVWPFLLPWLLLLPASVRLLLLPLSLPVQLPLLAASLRPSASLRRLLFFSSSSAPLTAEAASFRKRKKEEVLRALVCCFPVAIAKKEESVSLAQKVAASLRKRKEVRAFVLRPPCVCGCASEPLLRLLLHLLADLALVLCPVWPILFLL
jgi:hypothetical protein